MTDTLHAIPGGAQPLLTVEHLSMRFGGLVAIDDVSFVAGPRSFHRRSR